MEYNKQLKCEKSSMQITISQFESEAWYKFSLEKVFEPFSSSIFLNLFI